MSATTTMPRPVLLLLAFLCGCVSQGPGFRCASDGQCGAGGTCEAVGFCSFADPACTSGRRFGEFSGLEGGSCVRGGSMSADAGAGRPDGSVVLLPDGGISPTGCIAELAAGGGHTCARFGGGEVRCWGHNGHGALGDGSYRHSS